MSVRSNILLDLEYDGTAFYGWQQQADRRTVQGVLLDHLNYLFGDSVVLTGAGRTDRGVHALHMPASFVCDGIVPPERLTRALRAHLPDDLHLLGQREVPEDFNARFSAQRRSYRYLVALRRSVFARNHAWWQEQAPDFDRLESAARLFKGRHDFSAFCKTSSLPPAPECEIAESCWHRRGDWLVYHITANRFLHHMVRSQVGLMMAIGRGESPESLLEQALFTGERQLLPQMAPPHGLYLAGVEYPEFTIGELYGNDFNVTVDTNAEAGNSGS